MICFGAGRLNQTNSIYSDFPECSYMGISSNNATVAWLYRLFVQQKLLFIIYFILWHFYFSVCKELEWCKIEVYKMKWEIKVQVESRYQMRCIYVYLGVSANRKNAMLRCWQVKWPGRSPPPPEKNPGDATAMCGTYNIQCLMNVPNLAKCCWDAKIFQHLF